jgi:hypothetical protein
MSSFINCRGVSPQGGADYSEFGIITLPLREGKIFCKKILGGVKKLKVTWYLFFGRG